MTEELRQITDRLCAAYREKNKEAARGQIVFTGSSLMEQFPIEKFMKERGEECIIYNRGIGGYRCEDLMKVLDICVYDLAPRRVFINIGTNDLSDKDMPIAEMIDLYDSILTQIEDHVPGVELYLMAYYPINYDAAVDYMKECLRIRTNEKINEANREVERLAA
ncbi:MAG: lysophospholipase, partial [Lachnospiraceae bacterium]|nr:lysophospholipase [Lachnospiraceae bacterium]